MSVLENDFDGIVYFFLPPRGFCEVINYHQGRIKGGGGYCPSSPPGYPGGMERQNLWGQILGKVRYLAICSITFFLIKAISTFYVACNMIISSIL